MSFNSSYNYCNLYIYSPDYETLSSIKDQDFLASKKAIEFYGKPSYQFVLRQTDKLIMIMGTRLGERISFIKEICGLYPACICLERLDYPISEYYIGKDKAVLELNNVPSLKQEILFKDKHSFSYENMKIYFDKYIKYSILL